MVPPTEGCGSAYNLWGVLYCDGDKLVNTLMAPTDGGLYFLGGYVGGNGGPPEWHDLLREEHWWQAPQQFAPEDLDRLETIWVLGYDGVLRPGPQPEHPGDALIFDGEFVAWGEPTAPATDDTLIHRQVVPVTTYTLPHPFGRLPVVSLLDSSGRQMLAEVIPTDTTVIFTFSGPTSFVAILK